MLSHQQYICAILSACLLGTLLQADDAPNQPKQTTSDPYLAIYANYTPDFIAKIDKGSGSFQSPFSGWKPDAEKMKLSSEASFFTLNIVNDDSRANALVEAGLKKEQEGQFREALKIYQQVIEKYSPMLYRVSQHGIFVPVGQYCEKRILQFPASDLAFYRTLYDAQAREAFEQARRQYSLLGMADIAEKMLATSYGGLATLELGNSALDAGHFLSALEFYSTVRDLFPDAHLRTPELYLKIEYCQKLLGNGVVPNQKSAQGKSTLKPEQLEQFRKIVAGAKAPVSAFHSQLASHPHLSTDDYTLFAPTTDPLAIKEPTWRASLPGSRLDYFVYSQPVVTDDSIIYRHKNIIYSRSLLNGETRWTNDLGGRAVWQDWYERQYPQEDVLVHEGLVFTAINKSGPSLVALDEVTGQVRWAYGPMAAGSEDEAKMRFECAPAGGPRTVFSGYVLDNIEGETHTDSEYGLIAFDSRSGRVLWRTPLCRLAPGKFASGQAEQRRNRIRSFSSPPLYHQGTVYYNTNAGALVAVDALSGRVKWLTRYPYYPDVHDATRYFGRGGDYVQYTRVLFRPHNPMFWYNQKPLLVGEQVFFTPVDCNMIFSLERRSGRVQWSSTKVGHASAYVLGMTKTNELAIAYSGRDRRIDAEQTASPIHLLDPKTGNVTWKSPDLILPDNSPLMTHYVFSSPTLHWQLNYTWFEMTARPHMTSDGRVFVTCFRYVGYPIYGWIVNLGCLDLEKKQIVSQRRYYSGEIINRGHQDIHINGPEELTNLESSPIKDDKMKQRIIWLKEVIADREPQNEQGPFLPFSRLTFERFGVPFEVRMSPRTLEVVYDKVAVQKAVANQPAADSQLARVELAIAESRLDEAADLLQKSLQQISSEDLDRRAAINQQLYRVHLQLARRAVRANRQEQEFTHVLGMSRSANTLAEEIETLFAVSESLQRRGNFAAAAKTLQAIIATYGQHEYPVSPVTLADAKEIVSAAQEVLTHYEKKLEPGLFGKEFSASLSLLKKGLPLYLSAVSPLPKTLTVRAGEFASLRLLQLQHLSPEFTTTFRAEAEKDLANKSPEELSQRLWEYPGTPAAQKALEGLLGKADRRQLWNLSDIARVGGLKLPDLYRAGSVSVDAPLAGILTPTQVREYDFADEEGASRLVLERFGDPKIAANLVFIGSQLRKRLDNKFMLTALDLSSGKILWESEELRLKGKGQEPGFFSAFLFDDLVIVHGLYDVLALSHKDGKPQWRYQVPFDFEIRRALLSGELLVLAGKTETLALNVLTKSPVGELAWQVKEQGDLYVSPYLHGERIVSVRKLPYSVTVRYRATGQLIGRLDLPDLTMNKKHPLLENGPEELPFAVYKEKLLLSDAWYYILLDVEKLTIIWKRLIDSSDVTRDPAMRFGLGEYYLTVTKENYDKKAIYLISNASGEILWETDAKNAQSAVPLYSVFIVGKTVYGIQPHAGQGFYLVARDAESGKQLFRQEVVGYQGKPDVRIYPRLYGSHLVLEIADRQVFEIRAFDKATGVPVASLQKKGVGPIGVHGRISAGVQQGRLILLSKDKLSY